MAVPRFQSLMLPVLRALDDGAVHQPQPVCDEVAAQLGVSAEDQAELLPSGAMTRYRNRILWALHYMKRAGVIESPGRGQYVITDRGRALLAEAPAEITTKTLERYPGVHGVRAAKPAQVRGRRSGRQRGGDARRAAPGRLRGDAGSRRCRRP